jgi:hypothetical protein
MGAGADGGKCDAAMKPQHKSGLPRFDQESFTKGVSDVFRGCKWWPGPGTDPLGQKRAGREVSKPSSASRPFACAVQ